MIRKALRAFLADESGLETVEYAVMAALIVTATIVAVTTLGGGIATRLGALATTITTPVP